MKRQIIERAAHTGATPERTFAQLADSSSWPTWSPIGSARIDRPGSPIPDGVGLVRTLVTGRTTSVEEVVAFEPSEQYSYVLLSGLPIVDYRADVRLSPGTAGGTDIVWRSTFHGRFPLTSWIYRLALRRFIGQVLDGLVAHLDAE